MTDMLQYYYGQGRLYGALCDDRGLPLHWRWMGDVSRLALSIKNETRARQLSSGGVLAVEDIYTVSQQLALETTFLDHSPENIALLVYGQRWTYGEGEEKETLRKGIQAGDRVSLAHQTVWDVSISGLRKGVDYEVDPLWGAITFLTPPKSAPTVTYYHTRGYHIPLLTTVPTTLALRYEGVNLAEPFSYRLLDLYRARFNPADLLSLINDGNAMSTLTTTADVLFDASRQADPQFGQFGRLTTTTAFGARINLAVGQMGHFDKVAPLSGRIWGNLLSVVVSGLDVTLTATRSNGVVVIFRTRTDANGHYMLPVPLTSGTWTIVATSDVIAPDGSVIPVTSNSVTVEINTMATRVIMKVSAPTQHLFYVNDPSEDFTVDYGDGVESHDYRIENGYVYSTRSLTAGATYELSIADSNSCVFGKFISSKPVSFPNKILEVISVQGARKSIAQMFASCDELTTLRSGVFDYLAEVSDCSGVFHSCKKLTDIPARLFDKTPKVTSFASVFYECASLIQIPPGLFDETPLVVNFTGAFQSCSKLAAIPAGLFDRTPLVTTMSQAFYRCAAIAAIPPGLLSAMSQLTTAANMFDGLQKITMIPDGLFNQNTKLVILDGAFKGCSGLTTIPPALLHPLTKATYMNGLFQSCSRLLSIPAGLLEHNTALYGAENLFSSCSSVAEIPSGFFTYNTALTSLSGAFQACRMITSIPPGLLATTINLTSIFALFEGCRALKDIPSGLFDNVQKITTLTMIFSGCESIGAIPAGLFANNTKVVSLQRAFGFCYLLKSIPERLFDAMPLVTNASEVFNGCRALNTLPGRLFASNVQITNFDSAFWGCTALTAIPDEIFDTNSKATSFVGTFKDCTSLAYAPPGLLSQTMVSSMGVKLTSTYSGLFSGCRSLEVNLDVVFDKASYPLLKTIPGSFLGCVKLTGSGLAFIAKVPHLVNELSYRATFSGCTSLSDYNALPAAWRTE
ncbi:Mycoplasma protein of uncharacterised function%2C DUF285 [Yersinia aldovae]|uniref:phage tail tube protein n=1 Tax=Yersinia aldovae TaxID=29483 RepID=UPI0005DDCF6A|nr:BspA family leucine-rich repeat surface protein [Yersinia aldovae]CNJ03173.1 Mycoplasma protein of uncharacterised function%2C DUF285 [Yersinia aldovae]